MALVGGQQGSNSPREFDPTKLLVVAVLAVTVLTVAGFWWFGTGPAAQKPKSASGPATGSSAGSATQEELPPNSDGGVGQDSATGAAQQPQGADLPPTAGETIARRDLTERDRFRTYGSHCVVRFDSGELVAVRWEGLADEAQLTPGQLTVAEQLARQHHAVWHQQATGAEPGDLAAARQAIRALEQQAAELGAQGVKVQRIPPADRP